MQHSQSKSAQLHLNLLGQAKIIYQETAVPIQPKPLQLLAYLSLNWQQPHRRESLQAMFWPDKPPRSAANNLRQALWHLRQVLPPETLLLNKDVVQWHPFAPSCSDVSQFEQAIHVNDLDDALRIYGGPLLPEAYDEWVLIERERLHLCFLNVLEKRAHQRYESQNSTGALADAQKLVAEDPLNEAATRLVMACYWALGQREAARREYDVYQQRVQTMLQTDPLPETAALFQRILRGETHPFQVTAVSTDKIGAKVARLSLLETLGAFHQGLEQATAWAVEAKGAALAKALRWQGTFYLRAGKMAEAKATLEKALPLAESLDTRAAILTNLAATETGMGDFAAAEAHYAMASQISPLAPATRVRLLSSLGGLQGRAGRLPEAKQTLQAAATLARQQDDPALTAIACGNLGILLVNQGELETAVSILEEALTTAQRADAHWLTAHIAGHLGVIADNRGEWETAVTYYNKARTLAETFADQRGAVLWTMNMGVALFEQGNPDEALPLLFNGRKQAEAQGGKSLVAGANIYIGACLVLLGQAEEGLTSIETGLAVAHEVGDQERILTGYLHQGRALIALGQPDAAQAVFQKGLSRAKKLSHKHRIETYLHQEIEKSQTTNAS